MNLERFTTDELLQAIPAKDENTKWELKGAGTLLNKQELKKELGKQVSAFANSGGGYLVFGVNQQRQLEPCEKKVGRTTMADYLATMVEQSVDYPTRYFRVHPIPFSDQSGNNVYVIEIEDSPAAPHQAKDEVQYYYRIDGHSKPAPHFYLELLRSRYTKAILEIQDVKLDTPANYPNMKGNKTFRACLKVDLRNVSHQVAESWGVLVKFRGSEDKWYAELGAGYLAGGVMLRDKERPAILPIESTVLTYQILLQSDNPRGLSGESLDKVISRFDVELTPITNNHVGNVYRFGFQTHDWLYVRDRFIRDLRSPD